MCHSGYPHGKVPLVMEIETRIALGDFIRYAREAKGMTQAQLGERIGLSRASVTMLERGHTKFPKIDILESVAKALECEPAAIFEVAGVNQPGASSAEAGQLSWLAGQLDRPNLRRLIAIGHALLREQMDQPGKASR